MIYNVDSSFQAKKQNAEFANLVEQTKTQSFIKERISKRQANNLTEASAPNDGDRPTEPSAKKRRFKQDKPLSVHHGEKDTKASTKLLKSIFTKDGNDASAKS